MHYLGVCAIAKNESPFLREWVAHNYALGAERFLIYDNESDEPIAETLKDFVAQGVVEVRLAPGKSRQMTCYDDCLKRWRDKVRWTAFLDLDEFLMVGTGRDVRPILAEYEEYGGLSLNWRVFGPSGHLRRPEGLVQENFTERMSGGVGRIRNMRYKSIVQTNLCKCMLDPHQPQLRAGKRLVNERREPVLWPLAPHTSERIWINHYMYRSQQEWEKKVNTGRADDFSQSHTLTSETFYYIAREPCVEERQPELHLKLLRLAVRSGVLARYIDVDSAALEGLELYQAVELISRAIEKQHSEKAITLVELFRPQFARFSEFLTMAAWAHAGHGNFDKALEYTFLNVRRGPSLEKYYQQFLIRIAAGQREAAFQLGCFIKDAARYVYEDAEHPVAQALRAKDADLQLGIY